MHIIDSKLTLDSRHALETQTVATATLERICAPDATRDFAKTFEQQLNRLTAARRQDSLPLAPHPCCHAQERLHDMLETMFAMLFGAHPDEASAVLPVPTGIGGGGIAAAPVAPLRPHWLLTQSEQVSESESCQFSASGKVCLADGSERQFDVGFRLERSETMSRTVSSTLIDPLVVDSGASICAPGDNRVEFDLDSDGKTERMRLPGVGSAFLFLDRNNNGRADNGTELFGPTTGNGFAELARLDSDGNGWIDSADPAFADLRLWQGGEGDQQQVRRLDEAGVGALATASAQTPFQLKEGGVSVGLMRASSVWLGETGGAGVVRQIDFSSERQT